MAPSLNPPECQWIPSRHRERTDRIQLIPTGMAPYLPTGRPRAIGLLSKT